MFSTMLFNTNLTVGTIVSALGEQQGYPSGTQFLVIVSVVVMSAVVPTLIAKLSISTKE